MGRQDGELAVAFADVADNQALYQRLGREAASRAIESLLHAVTRLAGAHGGRAVKRTNDAAAYVFDTPSAALQAAVSVQAMAGGTRFGGEQVQLHVGLHYGPVYTKDGEIVGDTLSAAARLAATATRDQILATDALCLRLDVAARASVRPIFQAVLEGSRVESTVYQVLWRSGDSDPATVSRQEEKLVPRDAGSLLVCCGEQRVRIDRQHPSVSLGRSSDCDIVVPDMYASRQHATIKLRRMQFYLLDHSTNGTFVSMLGEEMHVLRGEVLLAEAGTVSLGRRAAGGEASVVRFERDRRLR